MIYNAAVRRRSVLSVLIATVLIAVVLCDSTVRAELRSLVLPTASTLAETAAALTAPEMEGRRSGTAGSERAAALIADWLRDAGLQPGGEAGSFFQSFTIARGTRLAAGNGFDIAGATSLSVGVDWLPHGGSANGDVEAEVVFVGHGISRRDQGYDDYAGVDVRGRIALALNGTAAYAGPRALRVEKLAAARANGARALLLIDDPLPELERTSVPAPVVSASVRRSAAVSLVPADVSWSAVESAPRSMATGRRVRLRVALEPTDVRTKNVVAILPGRDPALRAEHVVVGAHYDHLGRVGGRVHHGADDNASGTAVVVGLARALAAAGGTPRSLVFTLFGGEELGLLGSAHYVAHPSRPLDHAVGMVNFDMVGRLRDGQLTVGGADSGSGLADAVTGIAATESVNTTLRGSPIGPSDHASFYRAGVPVLFFHTGGHADYHRPTDTADKLDIDGMARIALLGARVVERLATAPRPVYATVAPPAREGRPPSAGPFLGVSGGADTEGARLLAVVRGSAADRAGLREGDVVLRLDGTPLASFDDLRAGIRARRVGDRIELVLVRDGEQRSATAVLEAAP
jgi:Iap family predicted aminopeptidase